ncbi:glycosyltransferase [Alkalicoccobacillus porphyridii]|nr:glycosyltransferase [Alkalicoccobacillus porphyridii]
MRNHHVTYRVIKDKETYLKKMNASRHSTQNGVSYLKTLLRNKNNTLHVIIPAMNEADTISGVLDEVNRLDPDKVIVVVNGSTDQTARIARNKGASVIYYSEPLGNDLGRAIGAMDSDADIYLFTDADIVIKAEDLLPFVHDIENGTDVSINSVDNVTKVKGADMISFARYYLNFIQQKPELRAENILTIPHAFSKKGLDIIHKATLTNPMLANAVAADKGLNISVPHSIDVLSINKIRPNHLLKEGEVMSGAMQRMHGDMVEALDYLTSTHGASLHYPPLTNYQAISDRLRLNWQAVSKVKSTTIVLAIPEQSNVLNDLCILCKSLDAEIIPVLSKTNSRAMSILQGYNLPYILLHEEKALYTYFDIGGQLAQGDVIFFHSADILLNEAQINTFIHDVAHNNYDISLNNQLAEVKEIENMNIIHIGNRLLTASIRSHNYDLDISSLLVPPFALKRTVLAKLSPITMQHLGRAYVKSLEQGLKVSKATFIDSSTFLRTYESQILSHQLDGIYYLLKKYGPRACFTDGYRLRKIIHNDVNVIKNTDQLYFNDINESFSMLSELPLEVLIVS